MIVAVTETDRDNGTASNRERERECVCEREGRERERKRELHSFERSLRSPVCSRTTWSVVIFPLARSAGDPLVDRPLATRLPIRGY